VTLATYGGFNFFVEPHSLSGFFCCLPPDQFNQPGVTKKLFAGTHDEITVELLLGHGAILKQSGDTIQIYFTFFLFAYSHAGFLSLFFCVHTPARVSLSNQRITLLTRGFQECCVLAQNAAF